MFKIITRGLIFLIIFLTFSSSIHAENPPPIAWEVSAPLTVATGDEGGDWIALDNNYVYNIGNKLVNYAVKWVIEKRDKNTGNLIWSKTYIPDNGYTGDMFHTAYHYLNSIALDESGIYVGGGVIKSHGNYIASHWRIEKRDKNTGNFIWGVTVPNALPLDEWVNKIAVDENYLYIIGRYYNSFDDQVWRIEKRDKMTGALIKVINENVHSGIQTWDEPFAIDIDESYVYIGGRWDTSHGEPFNAYWRIEKRRKSDLGLIRYIDEDLSDGVIEDVKDIKIDGQYLWAVGKYENKLYDPKNSYLIDGVLRIEKRRKSDLKLEKKVDYNPGRCFTILYSSPFGNIPVNSPGCYDEVYAVDTNGNGVYVAGSSGKDLTKYSDERFLLEKRDKDNPQNIIWEYKDNPSSFSDTIFDTGVDSSGIYAAAIVNGEGKIIKFGPLVSYIDCGLRAYDGHNIIKFACEPPGKVTSPLRIAKNGKIYGIVLVNPSDSMASPVRIKTSNGIKALRKL